MGLIYCLSFPNGKKYIGQTVRSFRTRLSCHKSDAKKLNNLPIHKAINKYEHEMKTEILCDDIEDIELLNILEIEYISKFLTNGVELYNISSGGKNFTGLKFSKESLERRSRNSKDLWKRPGYKNKMRNKFSELWNDPEYREKTQSALNEVRAQEPFRKKKSEQLKGSGNNNAKLNENKVRNIKLLINKGISNKEISSLFKVTQSCIKSIKNGRTWKHVVID